MTGGRYLFTANLLDRNSRLLVANVNLLHDAVRDVRARGGLRWRMALRLCALRVLRVLTRSSDPLGSEALSEATRFRPMPRRVRTIDSLVLYAGQIPLPSPRRDGSRAIG